MRAVVTGGAGFIGSHLVGVLLKKGRDVIVVDDFHTGGTENLSSLNVEMIRGSSYDVEELIKGKVDEIYHFGMPSSSPMYRENPYLVGDSINGAIAVFELARKNDAKVVYASTSSVYGGVKPPHREDAGIKVTDYYAEVRVAIERIAELYGKLYGTKSAGMRFFSVYGPNERAKGKYANIISQFLWAMEKGREPVIYGDGRQARDFIYVDDAVRACMLAMEKGDGVFNVGTGRATSFNEVVGLLNEELEKKIKPKHIRNPIRNYVDITRADTRKARKVLGFEAKVGLEEGIKLIRSSNK
jgi:UDP-glucose 4-epimerase